MKSLYFICCFFLYVTVYAQEKNLEKEIYNLMNEVVWQEGKNRVYTKPLKAFDSIAIELLIDSKSYRNQLFTAEDITYMQEQSVSHKTNDFYWLPKFVTNKRLHFIKRRSCLTNKWFIRSYALPLFTENRKVALVIDSFGGSYCYRLYENKGNKWEVLEYLGVSFSSP
jgi:hypothetical protein